jgi:hypothetical protein
MAKENDSKRHAVGRGKAMCHCRHFEWRNFQRRSAKLRGLTLKTAVAVVSLAFVQFACFPIEEL